MRKILLASAFAGAALAAASAHATEFVGSWSASYNSDDSGLQIGIVPIHPTFDITLSPSHVEKTISLFTIYTPESNVNPDDLVSQQIEVDFNFSQPTPNHVDPVTGETVGQVENHSALFGLIRWNTQDGSLTWDNSGDTSLVFGPNGDGLLTIHLTGGDFNSGTNGLNNGLGIAPALDGYTVKATFDWVSDASAAPEPATWALMLGGFGLAGAGLRRRRAAAAA